MSRLTPFPYQADAIAAMHAETAPSSGVVIPTGGGKTVVFSTFAEQWRRAGGGPAGSGTLVIAHRDELISQAVAKLRAVSPHVGVGIVKGTMNQVNRPVVVASIQSLRNPQRRAQVLRGRGLLIVDECHHAAAQSYKTLLGDAGCLDGSGGVQAFGFTATMMRGDGAALGAVWPTVCYEIGIGDLIRQGYLERPTGKRIYVADLDLSRVRVTRGDFSEKDLGQALEQSLAPETIVKAYTEHCPDKQGIIFTPTVATAGLMAEAMNAAGYSCAVVSGTTPVLERRRILADFMAGRVRLIANCMVMTEGTDLPPAEVIIIARPTRNAGLYIQMIGRGLRKWAGKVGCLVLDVVGASAKHSLIQSIELFADADEKATRERGPIICDECGCEEWERGNPIPCELCDHRHIGETVQLEDVGDEIPMYDEGELQHVEVDLFHGSASAWLRTLAGIRYIPCPDRLIALLPSERPGAWDVAEMPRRRGSRPPTWVVRGVEDLGYAMAYAEAAIREDEAGLAQRGTDWRGGTPTQEQRRQAAAAHIKIVKGMTRGELANAISQVQDSWRIDPYLAPHMIRG